MSLHSVLCNLQKQMYKHESKVLVPNGAILVRAPWSNPRGEKRELLALRTADGGLLCSTMSQALRTAHGRMTFEREILKALTCKTLTEPLPSIITISVTKEQKAAYENKACARGETLQEWICRHLDIFTKI